MQSTYIAFLNIDFFFHIAEGQRKVLARKAVEMIRQSTGGLRLAKEACHSSPGCLRTIAFGEPSICLLTTVIIPR